MAEKRTPTNPYRIDRYPTALVRDLDDYLQSLNRIQRNKSSIRKYRGNLLRFIDWLVMQNVHRFQDVDLRMIDRFCVELDDRNLSRYTIYSNKVTLRLFFRYLSANALLFEDPMATVEIRKPQRAMGLVLSRGQIHAILDCPDTASIIGLRDRAILETLYSTGIRSGELVHLRVKDLDLSNGLVKVTGKGDKERMTPIGCIAVGSVNEYLNESRPALQGRGDETEALWLGKRNARPISQQRLNTLVKTYAKAAGLPKRTDVHTFRRTCATHLLQGGAPAILIAEMLGHADLTSLSHYLKIMPTELLKAHAKTNPGQ